MFNSAVLVNKITVKNAEKSRLAMVVTSPTAVNAWTNFVHFTSTLVMGAASVAAIHVWVSPILSG